MCNRPQCGVNSHSTRPFIHRGLSSSPSYCALGYKLVVWVPHFACTVQARGEVSETPGFEQRKVYLRVGRAFWHHCREIIISTRTRADGEMTQPLSPDLTFWEVFLHSQSVTPHPALSQRICSPPCATFTGDASEKNPAKSFLPRRLSCYPHVALTSDVIDSKNASLHANILHSRIWQKFPQPYRI